MTTFTLPRLDDIATSAPESGFGSLQCSAGNLPLASLDYDTQLFGLLCRTTITQTFYNPFDENIEATYIFPIVGEQAVTRCELLVEDRVICAKLRERGQARADYANAIRRGHRAALLEENRPETFSMKVGNIPSGEAVRVRITTVGCLPVVQGEWTLRLPLVIAPRYTSGIALPRMPVGDGVARDTYAAPDASCVTPPTWLPGFASPVDLKISCSVQLGTLATRADWPQRLASSLHAIMISAPTASPGAIPQRCQIDIYPGEKVDRDFILRGKLEESQMLTSLEIEPVQDEKASSVFAIQVIPPKLEKRPPRDVVFLLDRSGSMGGWKMEAASRGVGRLIDTLSGEDRFALFAFDDTVERFPVMKEGWAGVWSDSSDKSRFDAIRWAGQIQSRGGTEMGGAMLHCLKLFRLPPSGSGPMVPRSPSLVLVTDGQITAEDSILRLLGSIPEPFRPRIYCLGVDRAVNASVLQRIAKFTGGTFELVESEKRLDEVMQRFASELGAPALTNVEVVSSDLSAEAMHLAPCSQRTLYEGRVARFFGRVPANRGQTVTIRGQLSSGAPWERRFEIPASEIPPRVEPALLPLWGKVQIREMEDAFVAGGSRDQNLREEIIRTSIESNALSRFTAFVAIDETHRVEMTGAPHRVIQPVELPEGWAALPIRREWLIPLPGRPLPKPSTGRSAEPRRRDRAPVDSPALSGRFQSLDEFFVHRGLVSQEQVADAASFATTRGVTIAQGLETLGYASDADLARLVAEYFGAAHIEQEPMAIPEEAVALLSEAVARENVVMPYAVRNDELTVLMTDPSDIDTLDKLRFILNKRVRALVAPRQLILNAINSHYGAAEGESADSMIQEFTDTQIDFCRSAPDSEDVLDDFDATPSAGSSGDTGVLWCGPADPPSSGDDSVCFELPQPADAPSARYRDSGFMRKMSMPKKAAREDPGGDAPIVRLVSQMLREAAMLKASHLIVQCLPENINVTLIIAGKPQEHDKIPTRLWDSLVARMRTLASMRPASRHAYETGQFEVEILGDQYVVDIHFAEGGANGPPSVLIELQKKVNRGKVHRVDAASQCAPVKEWMRLHAGAT